MTNEATVEELRERIIVLVELASVLAQSRHATTINTIRGHTSNIRDCPVELCKNTMDRISGLNVPEGLPFDQLAYEATKLALMEFCCRYGRSADMLEQALDATVGIGTADKMIETVCRCCAKRMQVPEEDACNLCGPCFESKGGDTNELCALHLYQNPNCDHDWKRCPFFCSGCRTTFFIRDVIVMTERRVYRIDGDRTDIGTAGVVLGERAVVLDRWGEEDDVPPWL